MDMRAKKENKVYRITTEAEKARYLKEGFDIYNEKGEIVAHSPLKKIAYGEYDKLAKEKAAVEAEKVALEAEIEKLLNEIEELEAKASATAEANAEKAEDEAKDEKVKAKTSK